jgi:hypothetical protein
VRTSSLVSALVLVVAALGCSSERSSIVAPLVHEPSLTPSSPEEQRVALEAREVSRNAVKLSAVATAAIVFDVPPEVFGTTTPVDNRLFYAAAKDSRGNVAGLFSYTQSYDGHTFHYSGRISCLNVYDFDGGTNNRVKLGGPIDRSDDPDVAVGRYMWWQGIDNALSPSQPPDKSTLGGVGDEAANIAFCQSPNPPRFGPFEVDQGDLFVRVIAAGALWAAGPIASAR